jgi:hypothetical protein
MNYTNTNALQAIINGSVTIGGKEIRLGGSFPYPGTNGAQAAQTMQSNEYKRQQQALDH